MPLKTWNIFSLLWKESSSNVQLCFGRRRFGGPIFLTSAPLCASSVLRFLAPLKHETWRSWLMISARIFRWKILLNSQGFLGISCSQCSDLILNIKSPYIPDSSKNYIQRFCIQSSIFLDLNFHWWSKKAKEVTWIINSYPETFVWKPNVLIIWPWGKWEICLKNF